jgi:hypothetical protein
MRYASFSTRVIENRRRIKKILILVLIVDLVVINANIAYLLYNFGHFHSQFRAHILLVTCVVNNVLCAGILIREARNRP